MQYLPFLIPFLSISCLLGLPIGNPASPQIIEQGLWISPDAFTSVKLGYIQETVTNRQMKCVNQKNVYIHKTFLSKQLACVTLNYMDRLEVSGALGRAEGSLQAISWKDATQAVFEMTHGLTAECEAKLLLATWKNFTLSTDLKTAWVRPQIPFIIIEAVPIKVHSFFHAFEWQAALAMAYTTQFLTPYLGCKYSGIYGKVKLPAEKDSSDFFLKLKSRHRFGMSSGLTLSTGSFFDFTVESQLFDETGWMLEGSVKF